jgi:hypothetical protein
MQSRISNNQRDDGNILAIPISSFGLGDNEAYNFSNINDGSLNENMKNPAIYRA